MAHNIKSDKNVFVVGEPAWHGLGTVLDKPATAEEALLYSGLGFEVNSIPIYFPDPNTGEFVKIPNKYATVRMDEIKPLGVVGSKYSILQNVDAFEFFDAIVQADEAIYHSAGVLGNGEKVWIMARLPEYINIKGMDEIQVYVSLMSTHDGTGGLKAFVHLNRIVCENTLQAALQSAKNSVTIRHTGDVLSKTRDAHKLLGITNQYAADISEAFTKMSSTPVNTEITTQFINRLFPLPPDEVLDKLARTPANVKYREEVLQHIECAPGQDLKTTAGKAFGLYNGVTHWLDHQKNYKDNTNRLSSVWFGNSAKIRQRAFDLALSIN